MKKNLLFILSFILITTSVWAQRSVTGKVTDVSGESLPGVTVMVQGTETGSVSDINGSYTVAVESDDAVLVFSSVGMSTQQVTVGTKSSIDVVMQEDAKQLNEVVVTALGGKRNAKEVVYANQTVNSEELLTTPNRNTLEALRGKTAGVRLSTGSGSVGASTRIVLRGESSLTGNNNALIVVDGVAIDNSTTSNTNNLTEGTQSTQGYADHGNRFQGICALISNKDSQG